VLDDGRARNKKEGEPGRRMPCLEKHPGHDEDDEGEKNRERDEFGRGRFFCRCGYMPARSCLMAAGAPRISMISSSVLPESKAAFVISS